MCVSSARVLCLATCGQLSLRESTWTCLRMFPFIVFSAQRLTLSEEAVAWRTPLLSLYCRSCSCRIFCSRWRQCSNVYAVEYGGPRRLSFSHFGLSPQTTNLFLAACWNPGCFYDSYVARIVPPNVVEYQFEFLHPSKLLASGTTWCRTWAVIWH